jgi:hypothetical protein
MADVTPAPEDTHLTSVTGGDPAAVGQTNAGLEEATRIREETPGLVPEGVDLTGRPDQTTPPPLETEDDQFLFGPTTRPDERFAAVSSNRVPLPKNIHQWVGRLTEAARDPNSPPELHYFLRLLNEHAGA